MDDAVSDLELAERAAVVGGELIAGYYARGSVAAQTKPDQSPVTIADREADAAIVTLLRAERPADAILSEESLDDASRLAARRVWIVDPLDGTRDFIARTGEFSVHVGLAVEGRAAVGAVYQPVTRALFSARIGGGAWVTRDGVRTRLSVSTGSDLAQARVGISRLNATSRTHAALHATGLERHAVAMGASVKLMALAEGALDIVFNLSPGEQEWDTCAPEVVIREAGGSYSDGDGKPFLYNQRDTGHYRGSLATNGVFHAAVLALLTPHLEVDTR